MQKPGLFGMNGFMVFLLTCFSFAARSQQQGYLILLDAENKQPFVVRLGEQAFFSSAHGHLVLSQLKDSSYKLGIRFPKKNIAEQGFSITIHHKDLGFQLKGSDSLVVLFNWQTKEILRPVYEKDSSRMLAQGIKRDDGFSRLMAAVVNDTAVMYDTYAGNGFGRDSAQTLVQSLKPKSTGPAVDSIVSGNKKQSAIAEQHPANNEPLPAVVVSHQPVTQNKDSLLIAKRQEMHMQDSLNTARKTTTRDSLISSRKQQSFLKDSLNTAKKSAIRDSIAIVKKRQVFLKDSLIAVRKATKDSLLTARKNGASGAEVLAAKRLQQTNDSLLVIQKEQAQKDSLLAVERSNFIKDSLDLASRSTVTGHHSPLTHVKKLREVSLKISRKMVFLDIGKNGRADTITLFVYFESADTVIKKRPEGETIVLKKPLPPDSTGVKKMQLTNKGSDTTGLSKTVKNKNTSAPGCEQAATESDTEALRTAIIKANSEQEKIAVAAGAFAMKCFSVSQVRFLASLLVSDKAKFGLMDAAHLHIVDRDHFPELVDLLTDKNFQRKFLLMAEKRS